MKVWSAIFNFIAVILIAFMLIIFYRFDVVHTKQFEEQRLRHAMDYATEAAFRQTLGIDDLGMDYTDLENIKINPSLALDTFKNIICLNYDMAPSKENFAHIESFIPTGVLFTNDGYYILEEVEKSENEYGLHWSMKRPYLLEQVSEGKLYLYALNIYSQAWSRVDFDGGVEDGLSYENTGLTRSKVELGISDIINQDINYMIYTRNIVDRPGEKMPMFYLPSNTKSIIMNTINKPALLIMMQNVDFACEYLIDAASVGGSSVDRKKVVVGFIENGIRYYCYEKQLPESLFGASIEFFDTQALAVEAGYTPHFEYLTKPKHREN